MVANIELSVVIPVFNEEKNINTLYESLKKVLDELDKNYEIIFIDDGSTDNSFGILKGLYNRDNKIRIIKFRRNCGQTAALQAGFSYVHGDLIITIDSDLQNDPNDIPKLLDKQKQGYDVVSGWRFKRKDKLTKKLFSRIADIIRKILIKDNIHDSGCSLKVYTKESIKDLDLFGEMHRFIPSLIALNGFKVGEVKVNHYPRRYGKTKYGFMRLLKGLLDLIYIKFWSTYSTRPLHFFGLLGFFQIKLGILIATANLLYHSIKSGTVNLGVGPLLLLAALLIILGVQFIVLGFLGEILIRTYYKDIKEKGYIIEKILQK